MRIVRLSSNVLLWLAMSFLPLLMAQSVWAIEQKNEQAMQGGENSNFTTTKIKRLSEIERPVRNVHELLSQSSTPQTAPSVPRQSPQTPPPPQGAGSLSEGGKQGGEVVQVTGVKANPTNKGVEVILQTTQGEQLQVTNRSTGNNFIVDIPNAQLRLPSGEAFTFRSEKPLAGITQITVTNIDSNTIRVTVTGEASLPVVELFDGDEGLIFGVASVASATQQPQPSPEKPTSETQPEQPSAQQDEPIELVVTGEQDGYRVPNASTATRTDTPLRDIPQSIQVVPQQVLQDRKVRDITDATETVSGVLDGGKHFGSPSGARIIRGFSQNGNFRNGYRDGDFWALTGVGTIEQVEVLKGPASVLFGAVEPGGIVNVVTKQPLNEPYYNLEFEAGNRGFYQPSIDLSGPLNTDKTLLYRFNASYQSSDGFQDFVTTDLITIAPSITLNLGDRTDLNLYYEYINFNGNPPEASTVLLGDGRKPPRSRYIGYPNLAFTDITTQKFGYILTHEFSDNWQIRNNFSVSASNTRETQVYAVGIEGDRFADIDAYDLEYAKDNYFGQIDLLGKFNTGPISHQLLFGFDFNRFVEDYKGLFNTDLPLLDIFNPNYNIPKPEYEPYFKFYQPIQSYGVYLQDQIALRDNLKLLIGGRFDWVSQKFDTGEPDTQEQNDSALSPRIGLVYQPSESVSLYTSYTQAFNRNQGFNREGGFKPTKGTQYEAGIKTDFLEGRLSATLAAYQITKTNVVTTVDPSDPLSSIQVGEQRSRGIELDIAGEILPGWKVIASYAYTNAEVTEDISIPVGDKLRNVPENQASLWTTYEIQKGNLRGLGFGLGLFYVGARPGDLPNSFEIEDYLRTDAAIYYRKNGFNAAINIRNLFDIYYFRSSESRQYLQIGEPFTITGSIGWEF